VEEFLDFACGFSAKLFRTVYEEVSPLYESTQFIFQNVAQEHCQMR
jgi:hypothetical protein